MIFFFNISPGSRPKYSLKPRLIANLLTWIGPTNLMNLILLILTDQKVAVFGRSFSALSEACRALTALIYPFKYSFPHIPVLPAIMLDYLMSPVPFLYGLHADRKKLNMCPLFFIIFFLKLNFSMRYSIVYAD